MKYHDSHLDTLVNWNMHITNITQKKIVGAAIRKLYTEGLFQDDLGKSIRVMYGCLLKCHKLSELTYTKL